MNDQKNETRSDQQEKDEKAARDQNEASADEASTREEKEIRKRLEDLGYL